jgi:hypothetical protein
MLLPAVFSEPGGGWRRVRARRPLLSGCTSARNPGSVDSHVPNVILARSDNIPRRIFRSDHFGFVPAPGRRLVPDRLPPSRSSSGEQLAIWNRVKSARFWSVSIQFSGTRESQARADRFGAQCEFLKSKEARVDLKDDELRLALSTNSEVKVMHPTGGGDHVWDLSTYDKAILRQTVK